MSDALRLATAWDGYATGDGFQRTAEETAAMLREQHAELTRLRAALSAPPPAVPAGWQLVPVEPTPEIAWAGVAGLEAASQSDLDATVPEMMAAYRAMVAAAAPQPPTAQQGTAPQGAPQGAQGGGK